MSADRSDARPFGEMRLTGGRYEGRRGLPVSTAGELARYEALILATARAMFLNSHSRRQRVPRGFAAALDLRIAGIEDGSVRPTLVRSSSGLVPDVDDVYEGARRAVNDALRAIGQGKPLPPIFPVAALKEFASFGRSLRDDEAIELGEDGAPPARLDRTVRRRVQALAALDRIESEVVLNGQVTGLQSSPQRFDFALVGGRQLSGSYHDETWWGTLREFQGFGERAPYVSLSAVARQTLDGTVVDIVDVLGIESALPREWIDRLDVLADLRRGWLPDTDAPSPAVLDLAHDLLLAALDEGHTRPGIYPSVDGGIQLEWRSPALEVELLNSGVVTVTRLDTETTADHSWERPSIDDVLDAMSGAKET